MFTVCSPKMSCGGRVHYNSFHTLAEAVKEAKRLKKKSWWAAFCILDDSGNEVSY